MNGLAKMVQIAAVWALAFTTLLPAQAQEETDQGTRIMRRVIRESNFVYLPLASFTICGPTVRSISASPDGASAIIVRRVAAPAQSLSEIQTGNLICGTEDLPSLEELEAAQGETQILLFGKASSKGRIIWRGPRNTSGYADISYVYWLPKTDIALVTLRRVAGDLSTPNALANIGKTGGPKVTLEVIRIDVARGELQTILTSNNTQSSLIIAEEQPCAVYLTQAREKLTITRLEASGRISTPISLTLDAQTQILPEWGRLLPDGKHLLIQSPYTYNGDAPPRKSATVDTLTGELTFIKPMKNLPEPHHAYLSLPYQITSAQTRFTPEDADSSVFGLWMEGRQGTTGRILIAADVSPFRQTVALKTASLYVSQGNLNAVPLLRVPIDLFENARQSHYNLMVIHRAGAISTAASKWVKEHGGQLPSLDELKRAVPNRDAFCNPETGKDVFTLAYTPGPDARVKEDDYFVVGYINLSWGRSPIRLSNPDYPEPYPDVQSATKPRRPKSSFSPRN